MAMDALEGSTPGVGINLWPKLRVCMAASVKGLLLMLNTPFNGSAGGPGGGCRCWRYLCNLRCRFWALLGRRGRLGAAAADGGLGGAVPPYSNIYIASCLEAVIKQQCVYWPSIYKRFIDDGFFVWDKDEASLLAFLQQLNSTLPNIRLTWHYSQTDVDYMDITISKCMDGAGDRVKVVVTTFQKPHNQYMYIPYHSFHRRGVYKGFIKAELQRYAVTNTLPADFARMKSLFLQRLLDRGYPLRQLQSWFDAVDHSCRVALLNKPSGTRRTACQQPVLVLPNGQFEMTAHIAAVLNRVFSKHKHQSEVAAIFGGSTAKLVVAYTKNRSIGAKLIRARQ